MQEIPFLIPRDKSHNQKWTIVHPTQAEQIYISIIHYHSILDLESTKIICTVYAVK